MPPNLGGFFMVRSYYPSECHADYFDFERIEALDRKSGSAGMPRPISYAVFCLKKKTAGNKLDEAIASFVRKRYNLMIGERTAEDVKIQIGSALPMDPELTMEVRGRDLIAGLPRTITIGSNEITEAMDPVLQQIIAAVKSVLEETPPELASDVIDKGMVLSGGGALLRNMDKLLTQVTGVACYVAENPLYCVAKGTGLALEHLDFFRRSLVAVR